ncbi:MAG: stage II sporulation protein P [Anaerotruncus sp.]|nr:stage II sporulation protein P [Anaerotruncus sp.]
MPTMLTAVLLIPLSLLALSGQQVDISAWTERAALLSAMVNLPEGSIELLKDRFAGQLDEDYYKGEEQDVGPYVEPWQDQENPDLPNTVPEPVSSASEPQSEAPKQRPPVTEPPPAAQTGEEIPEEHRGRILQENMAGTANNLIAYGQGKLRNYTNVPDSEVQEIMEQGMNIHLEDTEEPQVLIFHTHATEAYEPYDSENYDMRNSWRSTDHTKNMIAVGDVLEKELQAAGIGVVHDKTLHDYPSYNGAYERSAETIKSYLEKYPSIKIALDVHRDAIQREEDLIVKPTVEIEGKKAAQLMIITGSEDGTMGVPNWRENLRFAASIQDAIEQDYPHLTRPIFFCYRKYNMDLTNGSLLFEVGSQANTLEESIYTAQLVGKSLAKLLQDNRSSGEEVQN